MKRLVLALLLLCVSSPAQEIDWNNPIVVRGLAELKTVCVLRPVSVLLTDEQADGVQTYVEDLLKQKGFEPARCRRGEKEPDAVFGFYKAVFSGDTHYHVYTTGNMVSVYPSEYAFEVQVVWVASLRYKKNIYGVDVGQSLFLDSSDTLEGAVKRLAKAVQKARKKAAKENRR